MDPLIAKGVEIEVLESQAPKSQPAETLEVQQHAKTLAHTTPVAEAIDMRRIESTSGLSTKEKELILVDLQPSPEKIAEESLVPNLPQSANKFSVLQEQDDEETDLVGDKEDAEEIIVTEEIDHANAINSVQLVDNPDSG
ncbi:OLC1v1018626C1 [Oldenlandia corymbosa var. corymbosa]|uniref:OLC1v1018626C1 n=1 Tax=Oldenlandia corymbosa var. corymbosa TaxID=529605 RepID=A0AAV1EC53_OLDCO|nr:OLC1v1018626C1 [Oldenlandia corymbosa var. corymbosa]